VRRRSAVRSSLNLAAVSVQRVIYEQPCEASAAAREAEVVAAARRLVARHADIGAILFECTNFPPHRAAVEAATGLPVYDGSR
jgi:hypothetical protein